MTVRVYGRTHYAEPLLEVGIADQGGDVRASFDGEWVELVEVPDEAVHWIIRDGDRVDDD